MHKATRQSTPAAPDYPIKTGLLHTGQIFCYDEEGAAIPCHNSGQDGEFRLGLPWPEPRFSLEDRVVFDHLTGFTWPRDANLGESPMTWQETFAFIAGMNRRKWSGFDDWRLPNRRELRSLMSYQTKKPSLPMDHPFTNIFLGWHWTSTTAAIHPAYAWRLHLEGARMFYGRKDQYYLLWPVRGGETARLPATGQRRCYDAAGREIDCAGSGQDGEYRMGRVLPEPRFADQGEVVTDLLTGLRWLKVANLTGAPVSWLEALAAVAALNRRAVTGITNWRLPNINELEALVDCACHSPALSVSHPFAEVQEVYWSATTSFFERDWAWALYLHKGAIGVGYKAGATFHAWAVAGAHP